MNTPDSPCALCQKIDESFVAPRVLLNVGNLMDDLLPGPRRNCKDAMFYLLEAFKAAREKDHERMHTESPRGLLDWLCGLAKERVLRDAAEKIAI